MKLFERSRRIVKANSLSKLEKMENPLKMIRYSIEELRDGIDEIREDIEDQMKHLSYFKHEKTYCEQKINSWKSRAKLALENNKEDLAKEAVGEKLKFNDKLKSIELDIVKTNEIVESLEEKVSLLKSRLVELEEKEKYLTQREETLKQREKVEKLLKTSDISKFDKRYDHIQRLIDRKEAELATREKFDGSVDSETKFKNMEKEDLINKELEKIRGEL